MAIMTTEIQTPNSAPQIPPQEPPRPLVPGAFLRSEFEVKEVVSRGMTNLYVAQSGDYGSAVAKLIAERDVPVAPPASATPSVPVVSATPPAVSTQEQINAQESLPEYPLGQETATTTPASKATVTSGAATGATVEDAAGSGAFVEDVDALPNAPVPADESDPTGEMGELSVPPGPLAAEVELAARTQAPPPQNQPPTGSVSQNVAASTPVASTPVASTPAPPALPVQQAAQPTAPPISAPVAASEPSSVESELEPVNFEPILESPLFPPREGFTQEDREYVVFDYFETTALQDFREPSNDERLLAMLHTLAQGLRELDEKDLRADFTTDTLRVDGNGALRFVGFVENRSTPGAANGQAASGQTTSSHLPGEIVAGDALSQLREIMSFLLKRAFAESATMRLDDEFGSLALSEEVKTLARRISGREFGSIAEAAGAIAALHSNRPPRVESAILSDVGRERELNEDSGMIVKLQRAAHLGARALELYVVADGMGGHEGGEVASDLTMASLQKHLDARQNLDWNDNVAVRAALYEVIDAVNADVVALTETPKYKGTRAKPGSTLTFAVRLGARVFVGNIGDSRAYKYSAGKLERISKDHSYVQSLIDRGEITEEEAFDHPEGSVITAHIGYAKLKTRDVFLRLFAPGDKLLLVSDGVTDMLRDREYEPHLQHDDPALVCRGLVDASNAAGGADNITVVCVKFS